MKQTVLFMIMLSTVSFSQDFNLTGAGARAEGFGGAFIGLADDATAVVWNPSGLAQLERPEASIVTRLKGQNAEFTYKADPSLNSTESQRSFSLNFGSVAMPLKFGETKIVIAAAFQRQMDFYENRKQKREVQGTGFFNPSYTLTSFSESRGGVNTITPAVGIRLSSIISLGFSTNIWIGTLNSLNRNEDSRSQFRDEDKFELDYSGFNFVIGGLADFEGMKNGIPLKMGLTLRTPFTLKSTGVYESDKRIPPASFAKFDIKQDIEMPFMLGFGSSYRIGENLTIAVDYEIRNYGNKRIISTATLQGTNFSGTSNQDISESKQNLNEFRIGAEYLIVLDQGVIPLRGGFKTVPSVFADYVYDNSTGQYEPSTTQSKGSGFAVGTGFISDAFALDVTYSYASFTQKLDVDGQIDYTFGTVGSSVIIYF